MPQTYVYILASDYKGTLYIGVTNNLERRLHEHKSEVNEGFTKTYHVHRLVYFEAGESMIAAIEREKHLKHWKRDWKIELIETTNPEWKDLGKELFL